MKKKINTRLIGIAVLAILATVVGITIIFYSLFQTQVRDDLRTSANILKNTRDFEMVEANNLRITWIDEDGTVLYDNNVSKKKLSNHLDRPEVQAALKNGEGEIVRDSDTLNKSTFYYAILLDDRTVLRLSTDAKSLLAVFVSVAPIMVLIILFIIVACVVISHMLTRQLLKPIETMAQSLEDIDFASPYKELEPLSLTLRAQHTDILAAAKARQDFTANVSHELKTPLTAISGYAELLEGHMVPEEQKNHFYREIKKNSDRLLSLINDIIKLSELDQNGHELLFEEVDLYEIVKECMSNLDMNAKQRSIDLDLEGYPCIFRGNKDMLKELVENLVQNAIRYNNPCGKVIISTKEEDKRPILVVKDNGIGIPISEQERVFERFYRVDKSRSKEIGGTGLGLAIVKHIVDIHNARISLESAPGEGTSVTISF